MKRVGRSWPIEEQIINWSYFIKWWIGKYLSNLLLDTLSNLHHHFTCRSQSISAIRTRTSLYTGYYLPSSIKLWNELPLEFRNITSLDIFKIRLKVINKKRPSYYYIGSRLAQVLHARLRMDSSSLNVHLFLRNLVDNPNYMRSDRDDSPLSTSV
jgi:hypothetical protein